jgi:hypothetical protein
MGAANFTAAFSVDLIEPRPAERRRVAGRALAVLGGRNNMLREKSTAPIQPYPPVYHTAGLNGLPSFSECGA